MLKNFYLNQITFAIKELCNITFFFLKLNWSYCTLEKNQFSVWLAIIHQAGLILTLTISAGILPAPYYCIKLHQMSKIWQKTFPFDDNSATVFHYISHLTASYEVCLAFLLNFWPFCIVSWHINRKDAFIKISRECNYRIHAKWGKKIFI